MLCCALSAALLLSCASTEGQADPDAEDPQTHVIVFGALWMDGLLFDGEVSDIVMVRTGTEGSPAAGIQPYRRGVMFFTDPLPVGTCWKVASFATPDAGTILVSALETRLQQPGLLFLGSFAVSEAVLPADLQQRETPSERELLQHLLDAYRGTPWEPVIRSRIDSR